MGRCNKYEAQSLVTSYIRKVETQMENIKQNFEDMDIENAAVRNEFEQIINQMLSNCQKFIAELRTYHFS